MLNSKKIMKSYLEKRLMCFEQKKKKKQLMYYMHMNLHWKFQLIALKTDWRTDRQSEIYSSFAPNSKLSSKSKLILMWKVGFCLDGVTEQQNSNGQSCQYPVYFWHNRYLSIRLSFYPFIKTSLEISISNITMKFEPGREGTLDCVLH